VHSSFSQWRLLRKYSKKSGKLTIREPSLESKRIVDLSPFFHDYEVLLDRMDEVFHDAVAKDRGILSCGLETDVCCYEYLELTFVEAAYLNHHMNRMLATHERRSAIERAVEVAGRMKGLLRTLEAGEGRMMNDRENLLKSYRASKILCPLNVDGKCTVYPFRPIPCRTYGIPAARLGVTASSAENGMEKSILVAQSPNNEVRDALTTISANMLYALSSMLSGANDLIFSMADAVSGRFVQKYFELLVRTQDYNLTNGAEQCASENGKDK
jgi:Fe-S-cluster containining protein